jgi:uncharacterized membrane protein
MNSTSTDEVRQPLHRAVTGITGIRTAGPWTRPAEQLVAGLERAVPPDRVTAGPVQRGPQRIAACCVRRTGGAAVPGPGPHGLRRRGRRSLPLVDAHPPLRPTGAGAALARRASASALPQPVVNTSRLSSTLGTGAAQRSSDRAAQRMWIVVPHVRADSMAARAPDARYAGARGAAVPAGLTIGDARVTAEQRARPGRGAHRPDRGAS